MRGPSSNLAASDGVGIGIAATVFLAAGVLVALVALWKYAREETDDAILLSALATVMVFMAAGFLAK